MNKVIKILIERLSQRRWSWLSLLFLLFPTVLVFWEILLAGKVLFWGTPLMQFIPWYYSVVNAVRGGELPLWNPLVGNGAPLLANYQTAPFYPPNWLIFLIRPAFAMSWLMAGHVVWAGLGTCLYARLLGLRPFARLVSASSFMFSGYLVSRLGFASIGSALPWLPWLFWASERLLKKPALDRALVLSIVLCMQWLSGHAQTSFYSGLALALYLVWRLLKINNVGPRKRLIKSQGRLVLYFCVALALATGASLIQLLPTFELLQLSQRSAGVEPGFGLTYSLWPFRLIAFFTPRFFGHPATGNYWGYCCNYWEDNGYVGLLPLLLALGISWMMGKRVLLKINSGLKNRRLLRIFTDLDPEQVYSEKSSILEVIPFFIGIAITALVLAFGVHTPIYPWVFEHVPGFGQFQGPVRLLCLWTFSFSILAGIGAEMWRPTLRMRKAGRYGIVVGLALLIAAAFSGWFLSGNPRTFSLGIIQLGAGLLISGLFALKQPFPGDKRKLHTWSILVLLFINIDIISAVWGANPTVEPWLYSRQTNTAIEFLNAGITGRTYFPSGDVYRVTFTCPAKNDSCQRYLSFNSFGPTDTEYWFGMRETLLPNIGILEQLPSANNYDPLISNRYALLVDLVDNSEFGFQNRLLKMMGVEILITDRPQNERELVHANQDVYYYRIRDPLPRAFSVYNALVVGNAQEALEAISSSDFNPHETVVLEETGIQDYFVFSSNNTDSEIDPQLLVSELNNSIRIKAFMPSDGFLVLLDTYYPGWQALVDGKPETIMAANLAFRAVRLSAGEHLVDFIFKPASFWTGAVLSAITWLVIGFLFFWVLIRKQSIGREKNL